MKIQSFLPLLQTLGLITALALSTTASGFEIQRTRTEAEILPPNPVTPVTRFEFRARLSNDGFVDLSSLDVVIGWTKFGGVQPVPFKILIPAGCFGIEGFKVEDFLGCGVQMSYDPTGRGAQLVTILEFEASLVTRRNGVSRLRIEALMDGREQASNILGALGAGAVEITIGVEMQASPKSKMSAVSGVEPQPF